MTRSLLPLLLVWLPLAGCRATLEDPPERPAPELEAAVRWLAAQQRSDGRWGSTLETALASEALQRLGHPAATPGLRWLSAPRAPAAPLSAAARLRALRGAGLDATSARRAVEGAQLGDGRWRQVGWSDVLVTAFAAAALGEAPDADAAGVLRAQTWLLGGDGAWAGSAAAGPARRAARQVRRAQAAGLLDAGDPVDAASLAKLGVAPRRARTLAASYALDARWPERAALRALRAGAPLSAPALLGHLLTSEALADGPRPRARQWRAALADALGAQQRPDGSWGGSVVATAAALLALTPLPPA